MEFEINLENLVKMKRVFEVLPAFALLRVGLLAPPPPLHSPCLRRWRRHRPMPPPAGPSPQLQEADEDGSGELDPGEFYEKLGPYLGQGLTQTQARVGGERRRGTAPQWSCLQPPLQPPSPLAPAGGPALHAH